MVMLNLSNRLHNNEISFHKGILLQDLEVVHVQLFQQSAMPMGVGPKTKTGSLTKNVEGFSAWFKLYSR